MATSGSFEKSITSWLKLRVEWVVNSQNIATNKTNLTVTVYLVSTASNGVINSSASKTINLTINGTTYSYSAAGLAKISGSQKKQLFKKTVDVAHNADGTKSCSISCSFGIQVTLSGTYYGTVSTSGTATLNTIPRASSIASISGSTIGSSVTVNITPASSSFTHKVYYKAPNTSTNVLKATLAAGTNSTSFTPPLSDCSNIPNATSGTATITLETYSGSTKLGTVTKTFTLNVPSSVVPSISALSVSEAVSGLASKFGVYVQTKSKAAVSITAAGSYNSTIKSYTTTLTNGSTVLTYNGASFTSGLLSLSGTYTIKTVVTDSRGRTATKTTTITVVAYFPPEVNDFIVERWDKDTNTPDDEGVYLHYSVKAKVASVNNKNDKQIKFEYRIAGASSWTTLTNWANMSAYTLSDYNTFTTPTFSSDNAYEIRVSVRDYFTTEKPATKKADLPTARTIFDVLGDGTGFCIGGVARQSGVCEIAMRSHFTGGQKNLNAQEENNLDDFTIPNIYISKNNAATTYANLPDGFFGTFTLEVMSAGQEGQILQRATLTSKEYPDIRVRHYYQSEWGEWQRAGGLYPILTAHLSADTKTVADTYTKIPLAQELNLGYGLSVSDGSIKIGAGIKAVKVNADVNWGSLQSDGNRHIRIRKTSGTTTTDISWNTSMGVSTRSMKMSLSPKVVNVKQNDLISLVYYSASANDTIVAGSTGGYMTFLTVEVVA